LFLVHKFDLKFGVNFTLLDLIQEVGRYLKCGSILIAPIIHYRDPVVSQVLEVSRNQY
jgi:hypothetical protein